MHLFLDTNTYLGFFRLSDDNLEQLEKLGKQVGSGETTLYVTQQVRSEFRRNRESAINEALDTVRKAPKLPKQFAHLFESLEGYAHVRETLKEAERGLGRLMRDALDAVESGSLHADHVIAELFDRGKQIELTNEILESARLRVLLGNPPGKQGSIGDAVNWESLLREVPSGADLVLVTDDRDYKSKLDPVRLNQFLIQEWSDRKGSQIRMHGTLRSALEAHYPEIQLVPEPEPVPMPEQDQAVERLASAPNFSETHRAVRSLARISDFGPKHVEGLIEAAENNSQVGGILHDDDLFEFYDSLARRYGQLMESRLFDRLNSLLTDAEGLRSSIT